MTEPVPVLSIARTALREILDCAHAAYPLECCGLLIGRRGGPDAVAAAGQVSRVLPTPNRAAQPARAFEVDPAMHIALLRRLRERERAGERRPERVIGHYHSHPDRAAVPSARDLALAADPDAVWLIVAAAKGGCTDVRAWKAIAAPDGAFSFLPMALVERDD